MPYRCLKTSAALRLTRNSWSIDDVAKAWLKTQPGYEDI